MATERTKAVARPTSHLLEKSKDQKDAAFFNLPQEIREQIYREAFGEHTRTFKYDHMTIEASIGARGLYAQKLENLIHGLPDWLLSCKQICYEGIDIFLRTRYFKYNEWLVILCDYSCGESAHIRHSASSGNLLLFHRGSLVNVVFFRQHPAFMSIVDGALTSIALSQARNLEPSPHEQWLSLLKKCVASNNCGKLVWDRSYHNGRDSLAPNWVGGERELFDYFDVDWNGKIRKIKLTLIYHSKSGEGLRKMMELGESCVRRLVGPVSDSTKPVWHDEVESKDKDGHPKWQRSLTMERKI